MTSAHQNDGEHEGHDHDAHAGHDHEGHAVHDHDAHAGHDHDAHAGHDHDAHAGHDHGGHDHHGHAHDHATELREASRRSLIIAFVLIASFMVAEVIGGIYSGSLALLADAGHMLTDAAAIALALLAVWLAGRPESIQRTFGYHRTEILAAAVNAISLWVVAGYISFEGVHRIVHPDEFQEVEGGLMTIVGAIGLAVNIAAAFVLHRGSKHSVNVEGAFQHVLADMLGSVVVVISGIVVMTTGWDIIDPILSIGISVLIVISAWRLVSKVFHVLLGGTPDRIDLYKLCGEMEEVEGVTLIHDVHVWTLTSGYDLMTAHILVDPVYPGDVDALMNRLRRIASEGYGINHITLQMCRSVSECSEDHHVGHLEALARPS